MAESGELKIDVTFLAVPACDEFSNANGYSGEACDSIGYARVDAEAAETVVVLTEQILPYPHHLASLAQDRVDLIVQLKQVGEADEISTDTTRMTSNPREFLIARRVAEEIAGFDCFTEGFSLQIGTKDCTGDDPLSGRQNAGTRHPCWICAWQYSLDHGGAA